MDEQSFLQALRDLSLEDGHIYIQERSAQIADHAAFGQILKDEALRQRDIHPFTSLKLGEQLIFFGEHVQHATSLALGYTAKGDALSAIGQEQAAMDAFDKAAQAFLDMGDEVNWARTRIGWIISCAWLGRVEEALQVAARARAVFERHKEAYWVCIIDHNTAVIYTQTGQYHKALEMYDRMHVIYPTLTDRSEADIKRAIALVQLNQGRNLAWLGNFEQAKSLLQSARTSFIGLGQPNLVFKTEINLANLDYIQGYYGSALRRYYQIRDSLILRNFDNTGEFASTMMQMAGCLVKLDRSSEACKLAAEAVHIYRQLGALLNIGDALREYSTTLVASSRLKEALDVLEEAILVFTQGGLVHYATATKLQQAELLRTMGSAVAAYDQAYLLKTYFDNQGLISRSADACLIMAGALIERTKETSAEMEMGMQANSLQEAVALCEQVITLAGQHNLQEQVYKSQYLLGQIAVIQEKLEEAGRYYAAAIEQIEHMLDDLVYDQRPAFLHSTWAIYEDMVALCLIQRQVERAFSYLERARSTALRQYLSGSSSADDGIEEQEKMDTAKALRAKNAAVLRMENDLKEWQYRYHYYSAQLAALDTSVSPDVDQEVLQAELQQCEAKVNELFERLHLSHRDVDFTVPVSRMKQQDSESGSSRMDGVDVAQLRQHLVPGQILLAYFLNQSKLVIFAVTVERITVHENPNGMAVLERLLPPIYAHLEPRGWPNPEQPPQQAMRRLLCKLYDLLIAPVSALLPMSNALTIVPYGVLHSLPFHALYDGSHFLAEDFLVNYLPASNLLTSLDSHPLTPASKSPLVLGYSGDGHLLRAIDEAQTLAAMLNGQCYLEEEATITRLMEEAEGSAIIHLATHGHCRLDAPNFSYVRLADGQLNAIDAFSLNLQSCELVTLSGCETGLALSGGGDEQLGLGRAFLASGASALVMSLWPVEDNATSELMQIFYQRLLAGDSKVEALRVAQCHFLRDSSASYSHPYFWAAFRLVGDVGPLRFFAGALK